jgi:hypothetical protein
MVKMVPTAAVDSSKKLSGMISLFFSKYKKNFLLLGGFEGRFKKKGMKKFIPPSF